MKKPTRVLVGLKTVEQAPELTDPACRISARGASLLLVHVIEIPDQTPLDAAVPDLDEAARRTLSTAERIARRARLKTKPLIVRSHSAGLALLDELTEKNCDFAVLGYHHPHTIGEVIFGTTARHVMAHAPCRVLLSVPPRQLGAGILEGRKSLVARRWTNHAKRDFVAGGVYKHLLRTG